MSVIEHRKSTTRFWPSHGPFSPGYSAAPASLLPSVSSVAAFAIATNAPVLQNTAKMVLKKPEQKVKWPP